MGVLLSGYGSRGGIEPVAGLAVRLRPPATAAGDAMRWWWSA
jgi:hypothetical protein